MAGHSQIKKISDHHKKTRNIWAPFILKITQWICIACIDVKDYKHDAFLQNVRISARPVKHFSISEFLFHDLDKRQKVVDYKMITTGLFVSFTNHTRIKQFIWTKLIKSQVIWPCWLAGLTENSIPSKRRPYPKTTNRKKKTF